MSYNNTTARIGASLSRIDGRAKVTGEARYAGEHPAPDLLYGWVVSAPIAKGRIVAVDDTLARAVPGVVVVITHLNRPHVAWLDRSYEDEVSVPGSPFRPLYDDKVVFSHQPWRWWLPTRWKRLAKPPGKWFCAARPNRTTPI